MDSQINIKRSMEWKEFETTFSVKLNQQQKEAVQSIKRAGTASCCCPGIRKDHGTGDTSWLYDLL